MSSSNQSPTHNQNSSNNSPSIVRYKASYLQIHGDNDNPTSEYMNVLCMIFSMLGLMMKIKFAGWLALFSSSVCFANSRVTDESKQLVSSFMLSISAIVVTYLQSPAPLTIFNSS